MFRGGFQPFFPLFLFRINSALKVFSVCFLNGLADGNPLTPLRARLCTSVLQVSAVDEFHVIERAARAGSEGSFVLPPKSLTHVGFVRFMPNAETLLSFLGLFSISKNFVFYQFHLRSAVSTRAWGFHRSFQVPPESAHERISIFPEF